MSDQSLTMNQALIFACLALLVGCLVSSCASTEEPKDPVEKGLTPDRDWRGGQVESSPYEVGNHTAHTARTRGRDLHPEVVEHGRRGYLYFSSDRDGKSYNIYRKLIRSSSLERVTESSGDEFWPRISPCGRWLAYGNNRHGNWDIYVMDLDNRNSAPMRITSGTGDDIHPTWSPDSTHLVYSSFSDSAGDYLLAYVKLGSASHDTASTATNVESMLAFSGLPRGTTHAMSGTISEGSALAITESGYIMSSQNNPLTGIHPDFRPTAPYALVYQDYRRSGQGFYGLKVYNWSSGQLMLLDSPELSGAIQPRWSPMGDKIVYTRVLKNWNDNATSPIGGDGFGVVTPSGSMLAEFNNPTSMLHVADPVWVNVDGLDQLFFSASTGEGKEDSEVLASVNLSYR